MATKQFLDLTGLQAYDTLIKQYIGTEDAKSIKSITVVGNTVNFYKNASASGDPSYTVNLPDVSGFMDKIENPDGGKIVVSDANGGVEETDISPDDIITGYFRDDATDGDIVVYSDGVGAAVSSLNLEDVTTGYFSESTAGDIVVFDGTDKTVRGASIKATDIMEKIDAAAGGYLAISTNEGGVSESSISEQDVSDALDDIAAIQTAIENDMISGYGTLTAGKLVETVLDEENNKMAIRSTDYDVDDIAGLLSDVSDLQTDKMDKIDSATGGSVVVSTANGGVEESPYTFVTGYITTQPGTGDIVVFGQPRTGENTITVNGTGVSLSSIQSGISTAQGDVDALEALVGSIPSGATATTVVGYIDEAVDDLENSLGTAAYADVATSAITEQSTDDSLVTAEQVSAFVAAEIAGLEGAMHFRGVITRQAGETDAQAIARVITDPEAGDVVVMSDNAKEYVYDGTAWDEVGDETEFVKKTTTIAGVDLQDNITASELRTALNVADGAQVNVVETVKVNGSALTPDANKAVNVTVAEGATNGTVAVNGSDVAVHGLGSAAYTASTAYEAAGAVATAVAALDATPSQSAGADGLALSLTEVDGVVTAISGSIAANTYDAYGAASTAESNANTYTDNATAAIATADIEALFS